MISEFLIILTKYFCQRFKSVPSEGAGVSGMPT